MSLWPNKLEFERREVVLSLLAFMLLLGFSSLVFQNMSFELFIEHASRPAGLVSFGLLAQGILALNRLGDLSAETGLNKAEHRRLSYMVLHRESVVVACMAVFLLSGVVNMLAIWLKALGLGYPTAVFGASLLVLDIFAFSYLCSQLLAVNRFKRQLDARRVLREQKQRNQRLLNGS